MGQSDDGILYFEAGQDKTAMVALTDAGDFLEHNSAANLWSDRSGYEPDVKPDGLATGGVVTPAVSGTNDLVDVAPLTCFLAGVETDVGIATDETCLRGATTDVCRINSITVDSGGAIAVVSGVDHTAFGARGAVGGAPWIPVGDIEIAQVKFSAIAAAAVLSSEIFQVPNDSLEQYFFPTFEIDYSDVANNVLGYAGVTFNSALPQIHSDDAGVNTSGKGVFAEYYEPVWAQIPRASDFAPPANSHSVNSKQIYGMTLGSKTSTLGQGSFTAFLADGITDSLLTFEDDNLWFKFKQDRLKDPYVLCQGYLGIPVTFPAGDEVQASCTISAAEKADRVNG